MDVDGPGPIAAWGWEMGVDSEDIEMVETDDVGRSLSTGVETASFFEITLSLLTFLLDAETNENNPSIDILPLVYPSK